MSMHAFHVAISDDSTRRGRRPRRRSRVRRRGLSHEHLAMLIGLLLALILSGLAQASDPLPSFSMTILPTLPGGSKGWATDINNNGILTGYATTAGHTTPHAFVWDPRAGAPVDLGTLSGNPADESYGWAIADANHAVGDSEFGVNPYRDAFFAANGVPPMTPIGPLPPGYVRASAQDIRAVAPFGTHRVVGWFLTPPPETPVAMYLDFEPAIPVVLGSLTGLPGEWSRAFGVNTNGDVVGFSTRSGLPAHAFFSPQGQTPLLDIDTRPGGGDSFAYAINAARMIVGFQYPSMSVPHHACRFQDIRGTWTMTDLGRLPNPTDVYSLAWAIAESGLIVGWSNTTASGRLACMWLNDQIYDLNALVVGGTQGYTLKEAMGVNDQGQIVGYALDSAGFEQGYVLTPANLIMTAPVPGIAGQMNTLTALGAVAGTRIYFVYGFTTGSTGVPGCPGLTVNIANPVIIGSTIASPNGLATLASNVPLAARNRLIRLQAVDVAGCQVSNVVAWQVK